MIEEDGIRHVVGGVDTHKDLHVAAVVDERDLVLGTRCFATTRQGYRQMLDWMRSFGELRRVGIESTGSYGAGLLRFVQKAGIEVLEVTTPDNQDRRRRGMISMPRTRRMQPSPVSGPLHPEAATEWSSPCGSSRLAARPPWPHGASLCR